jgi:lipopolysaccharide biosynthesis glycosyltransferase
MSTLVVTAANEPYATLAGDLVASLADHREALKLHVAVLDLGLEPTTRDALAGTVDHLVAPKWMFAPHAKFDTGAKYLSRAVRPFLPEIVPGYATYIWLDADVWVQHRLGLEWLIDAARGVDLAAVPTMHRSYTFGAHDIGWLHQRYVMAFGAGLANELIHQPYFNSGVMAARAGSPLWRTFAERFQRALDRWDGDFLSDQAVLNAVIAMDGLSINRLPARVNWLCHLAPPVWNEKMRTLVEPAMPFDPLLIVHNTYDDKRKERPIRTFAGQPRMTQLTRSAIQQLAYSDSQ